MPCFYSALSLFVPVTIRYLDDARPCFYRAQPNRRTARHDKGGVASRAFGREYVISGKRSAAFAMTASIYNARKQDAKL